MDLEDDWSRPVLESGGWLVAHRRNQIWLQNNPVHLHWSSLAGVVSVGQPPYRTFPEWWSRSLRLLNRSTYDD